jgi:hypothetical protein
LNTDDTNLTLARQPSFPHEDVKENGPRPEPVFAGPSSDRAAAEAAPPKLA